MTINISRLLLLFLNFICLTSLNAIRLQIDGDGDVSGVWDENRIFDVFEFLLPSRSNE